MDLKKIIEDRYSVRQFTDEVIDNSIVEKIIDLARKAPSAKNKQPYRVYLINDPFVIEELRKTIKSIGDCKNLLLITSIPNEAWINKRRNDYNIVDIDVGIFSTYIMLSAWNYGIGSCMIGMFDDKDVRKIVDLKVDEVPALFLALGYISPSSKPSEQYHYYRKSVNDILITKN